MLVARGDARKLALGLLAKEHAGKHGEVVLEIGDLLIAASEGLIRLARV